MLKSAINTSPVTPIVQSENTIVPAKNEVQEKLARSDFPLIQAKKTEAHDKKQGSETPWLPAPTRKKPVLRTTEPRPSTLQVAQNRNMTVPPKDEHHFPALGKIKTSRKITE